VRSNGKREKDGAFHIFSRAEPHHKAGQMACETSWLTEPSRSRPAIDPQGIGNGEGHMKPKKISTLIGPDALKSLGCPYKAGDDLADAWMTGFYAAVKFYGIDEDDAPLTDQEKQEFIEGLRG
jgi:hypothetical protein